MASIIDAWIAMGSQVCAGCGLAMVPAAKGPGADEPGYCGFMPCPCGKGDVMPRPSKDIPAAMDAVRDRLQDKYGGSVYVERKTVHYKDGDVGAWFRLALVDGAAEGCDKFGVIDATRETLDEAEAVLRERVDKYVASREAMEGMENTRTKAPKASQ